MNLLQTTSLLLVAFASAATAQISVTDPDFQNTGGTTVTSDSGNLYFVNTANFGIWQYNDNYWTYDATGDAFDFDSPDDFRGWPVTQLIDTGSANTTGSYNLDFTYSANNVSDAGTRAASLIYKAIGINTPGSLTDASFNARTSSVGTVTDAINSAMEGGDIAPAGTEILEGFVDLSGASNVVDATESVAFSVASDFDSILLSFSGWGFDTDNAGESLSLSGATVAVPEHGAFGAALGLGALLTVIVRRQRRS